MAFNDIITQNDSMVSRTAPVKFLVTAGATTINAGEPVTIGAVGTGVTAMPTNAPTAAIPLVGIATGKSTQTATKNGIVFVQVHTPGQFYSIAPKVAITTQVAYNALIGSKVLIDLATGSYTLLAANSATNGCRIEYSDIAINPNRITFSISNATAYNA